MATTSHYKSTFTGNTSTDGADSPPNVTLAAAVVPHAHAFEVNIVERSSATTGSGPVYTTSSNSDATKLDAAEARNVANACAAAFKAYLGSTSYASPKVQRIVVTLEMKG